MLHDIENSKRINTAVNNHAPSAVDCIILSNEFWPLVNEINNSNDEENMLHDDENKIDELPDLCINNSLDIYKHYHPTARNLLYNYHNSYKVLKKPRKLIFLDNSLLSSSDNNSSNENESSYLGFVELELSFEDGTNRIFSVSPMHVSLQ